MLACVVSVSVSRVHDVKKPTHATVHTPPSWSDILATDGWVIVAVCYIAPRVPMPYSVSHVTRKFPRRRPLLFLKVYRDREGRSGGDGADPNEEGEASDAIHSFNFMQGHLPTMMWEDLLRLQAGGDDNVGVGDAVIPDGKGGSGSSVPGGPGVRSTVPAIPGKTAADAAKIARKKRDAAKADERSMQKLRLEASGLISKISAGIDAEPAGKDALDDDEEDRRAEEAADKVDR